MKKSFFIIALFISILVTLFFTKYDYGSNIFGRYCKGNDFYSKPVCIEATQKRPTQLQSEGFKSQDYYYLSVTLPVTKYSFDFKNPTFGESITLSQFGYAMSNPHFYLDAILIYGCFIALYFLLTKIFFIKK